MNFINHSWTVFEFLYYLSAPILVVVGVVGLIGLYLAKKEFNYKIKKDSIQRAVELTQYYIKEILPAQSEFNTLFKGSQYETEMKKFNQDEFCNFDLVEMRKIIMQNHAGESFEQVIANISKFLGNALNKKVEIKDKDGKTVQTMVSRFELDDYVNNLEYFAMNFVTGIADKETVYRALHQTYLATVRNVYFVISFQNDHPKDKFFNNIIELYQEWNSSDQKIMQVFEQKNAEHAEAVRTCVPKGKSLGV